MSALVLTPGFGGRDGVARVSREIALALESGISEGDVAVWSLHDREDGVPLDGGGIFLRGAGGAKSRYLSWAAAARFGLRPDVVIVTHAHLAPLSFLVGGRGTRIVQWLHGIEVWKPLSLLERRAFARAERLVAVSSHSALRFAAANPGFPVPSVCHPGLPALSPGANGGEARDEGFALTVGRMAANERYKGHDLLLDIWPRVSEGVRGAKLVVAGDGDDRSRLESKARALGLDGAVTFRGGVSDEELDALYRRCAFFVMPSRNEGFGLVFLEAMRSSKACIAGVGAPAEILEDGSTGFVVDPADRGGVLDAVLRLFHDRKLRVRMGERGFRRFQASFTRECFRERLSSLLVRETATPNQ